MQLISFYTSDNDMNGDFYSSHATNLMQAAEKLKLDHTIVNFDPDSDWPAVTRSKPILMQHLLNVAPKGILWVDAVCELVRVPKIKDKDYPHVVMKSENKPHVYVMYLPNNQRSRRILWLWAEGCRTEKLGDHDALIRIWPAIKSEFRLFEQPPANLRESGNWDRVRDQPAVRLARRHQQSNYRNLRR